jgi:hypothetical protein
MTSITATEASTRKQRTYRYFVQLVSTKLDEQAVPESYCIVDVVVLENSLEAIKTVIARADWLTSYRLVAHWIPCDCTEF